MIPKRLVGLIAVVALILAACASTATTDSAQPNGRMTDRQNFDQIDFSLTNTFSAPISFNQNLSWVQNGNYGQIPDLATGATGSWTVYGDPTDPNHLFEGSIVFTTSENDLVYLSWSQTDRLSSPIYELYGTQSDTVTAIPAIGGQITSDTYDGTIATVAYDLVFNNDWSPPSTKLSVQYDASSSDAVLSWTPPNTQALVSYNISVDDGVHTSLVATDVPVSTTTYAYGDLTPGVVYRFVVKGMGDQGSLSPSNWVTIAIADSKKKPTPPRR